MGRRERHPEGPSEAELFLIELESLSQDYDDDVECRVYEVEFSCLGPEGVATATVTVVADRVTTTEIVPHAMSHLHRLFAALAEQTRGWLIAEAD